MQRRLGLSVRQMLVAISLQRLVVVFGRVLCVGPLPHHLELGERRNRRSVALAEERVEKGTHIFIETPQYF